ncbi:MAG: hypothetical protein ACE5ID_00095 [Acidobacteriota bacterium]
MGVHLDIFHGSPPWRQAGRLLQEKPLQPASTPPFCRLDPDYGGSNETLKIRIDPAD